MLGEKASNLNLVPGVDHLFMGRIGGTSPKPWDSLNVAYDLGDVKERVDENRARIAALLRVSPRALFDPDQVHGTRVVRVTKSDLPSVVAEEQADAIWTTEPGLAVAVQTADCAPVLIASEGGEVVCAIHAGWRGAVAGIVPKTLETIAKETGLLPEHFLAAIGPCIGFEKFEVGPEVAEAVRAFSFANEVMQPGQGDRFYLDLAGLIRRQLKEIGVTRVEALDRCTMTHNDRYFSYRGGKGKRGNQISVIVKR